MNGGCLKGRWAVSSRWSGSADAETSQRTGGGQDTAEVEGQTGTAGEERSGGEGNWMTTEARSGL